jgi:hypothetical protein
MNMLGYYWGRTPVAFLRQGGAVGYATANLPYVLSPISSGSYLAQEIIQNPKSF